VDPLSKWLDEVEWEDRVRRAERRKHIGVCWAIINAFVEAYGQENVESWVLEAWEEDHPHNKARGQGSS